MELSTFIQSLVTEGKVSVKGVLIDFEENDLRQTASFLKEYYEEDVLEMPFTPPSFSSAAAIWAAQYFYLAVQLTVLRDEEEAVVTEKLQLYSGRITPESIYSVDLVFRRFNMLFDLAKGLSPADQLIQELKKAAKQWPFSCVGMGEEEITDDAIILNHPSLQQTYIDRIIDQKDSVQIKRQDIKKLVMESPGAFYPLIWPELDTAKINP